MYTNSIMNGDKFKPKRPVLIGAMKQLTAYHANRMPL